MSESKENTKLTAFSVLQKYQKQLDPDGLDVGVIRQALEEVLKDYCKLEARLAKWESGKNPDHYGPHCAGSCEGAAYTAKIRELEARLATFEGEPNRVALLKSNLADLQDKCDSLEARLANKTLDIEILNMLINERDDEISELLDTIKEIYAIAGEDKQIALKCNTILEQPVYADRV